MDEKGLKNFFRRYWLAIVLSVAFLLRLPSLLEPLSYGDEAIYLTLGQAIRKGLLLYRDIYDNKPPLLYLLAAIAGNLFWFRFILTIFCLTAIVVMSKLIETVFPKSPSAKTVGTTLFALIISLPTVEGIIANSEIFQILPTVTGVCLVVQEKVKTKNWFFAGLLFSLAILFKIPAIFDFAAVVAFLVFFTPKKRFNFPGQLLVLATGFLLPLAASCLYFGIHHQLRLFSQVAFMQNLGYLSSWKTGTHTFSLANLSRTDFFLKGMFIFSGCFILWWQKAKMKDLPFLAAIWLLFSLFGATLSERPYPHYLIQALPSFTLMTAYLLVKKPKAAFFLPLSAIILVFVVYKRYHFWYYPALPRYKNFLDFSLGKKDKKAYFSYFNGQLPQIFDLAEQVLASTQKNDHLFVWGDDALLYVLTQRLPPTPYVTSYHIIDFNKFEKVASDLQQNLPRFIIVKRNFGPFPQLEIILRNNYLLVGSQGDYDLFSKRIY